MTKYIITGGILLFIFSIQLQGQVTDDNNNPVNGNYVGFDNTSMEILPIQNIGDPRINVSSNGQTKVYFDELATWNGLNSLVRSDVQRTLMGLTGQQADAWSILHLYDDTDGVLTQNMYRDWLNVGVSYTANQDFMYTGLLERPVSANLSAQLQTDAVIAWGCQQGDHPDSFRILFLAPQIGISTAPKSDQGLETFRISPIGNVGIGDFSTLPYGLDEQPTQKLDVDGTARLRQMPNEDFDVIITGVCAEEDPCVDGDYILNYSTIEDFIDQADLCEWDFVGGGNNLGTGYATACRTGQVLVGTDTQTGTSAKVFFTKDYAGTTLHVNAKSGAGASEFAGIFEAENGTFGNAGIIARGTRGGIFNYGVRGYGEDADYNYGVSGEARDGTTNYGAKGYATAASAINYGVWGQARGTVEPEPVNNVGVFGEAGGASLENNFGGYFRACGGSKTAYGVYTEVCDTVAGAGVAGYFAGPIQISQPPIALSDESVKTNMSEIEGSIDIIGQLSPKSYFYNNESYAHLMLETDKSYGFSAQEVQAILPEIVEEFHHPAKYDTAGVLISPEENLLGIQYQELIAILTAGIKEQQTQIDGQAQTISDLQESLNNQNDLIAQMMDQMDALTQQVSNCCGGGSGELKIFDDAQGEETDKASPKGNVLNQNMPNPFRTQTTITYELQQGGKVMLNVYDKSGKVLTTLVEANQQPGEYRYEWDATGQPAGLYHYALYVDGELLVKKAIKLAD